MRQEESPNKLFDSAQEREIDQFAEFFQKDD
jgi:hypothetical protein